jgi:hypothetical protein
MLCLLLKGGGMKRRNFTSLSLIAIAIICLTWPAKTLAADATLGFETQAIDLDTGTITEQFPDLMDGTEGTDILIGYNADRIPHAILMPVGEGVTLAVMSNTSYDSVTAEDVAGLSFSAGVIDQPLEASDTVVVKTGAGATFKLGNVFEDEAGVTFNYEQLN